MFKTIGKRIRLSKKDSVFSTNKENTVDVELKTSSKLLPYPDYVGEVNSQTVYEDERKKCEKYRLIVTVNPYCSNVLFNALTEIVKNEGSGGENIKVISDGIEYGRKELTDEKVYGKESGITRQYLIDNTELSSEKHGYVYLPGMNIFSNHILRNTSFKMVCDYSEHNNENRDVFNTIADYMRYADGKNVLYNTTLYENNDFKLKYGENEKRTNWKHLYNKDDILGFEDASVINERLVDDNGWYGFRNNSSVPSKTSDGNESMLVEKVLNNYDGCEFVDMYPDRSLFSFSPKYNIHRRRLEYNWDVCLTYPYKNKYDYDLFNLNGVNTLRIMYAERKYGTHGEDVLMFRTYSKHGLKKGSMFAIYVEKSGYVGNDGFINNGITDVKKQNVKLFRVYNVGDMDGNNRENFFYINDGSLLDILGIDRNKSIEDSNVELYNKRFGFNRCVGNTLSSYYLRVFKKIPNFKWKKSNLTEEIAKGNGDISFDDFVSINACEGNKMYGFDNEWYKLAFANTIYNDDISQITFTDDIDIEHLRDNLGRKLSDVYITFVKSNRGNKEWYDNGNFGEESVEFSHAFGDVTSGIRFLNVENDKYYYILNEGKNGERNLKNERASLCDVNFINNLGVFESKSIESDLTVEGNNEFVGDLVDFNPSECIENVLDDVMHRFNTKQRELSNTNTYINKFVYREIMTDDYDKDDFALGNESKTDYIDISAETHKIGGIDLKIWQRPEGYYYKPHHSVMFKELGQMKQLSHFEVKVKNCIPVQLGGIYLSVSTKLPHNIPCGDIVWFCDDENSKQTYDEEKRRFVTDRWYPSRVVYVNGKYEFVVEVPVIEDKNWFDVCEMVMESKLVIRRRNEEIPEEAFKIGKNKFVWRNVLKVGDIEVRNLPEYTFTNGSFYVNREINFFVRRQDGENINGLYAGGIFPNDIEGKIKEQSNYAYKEEGSAVC